MKILIAGAHGATAQLVAKRLIADTTDELVLFLRDAKRLGDWAKADRVTVVEGDVKQAETLVKALTDVDVVYSNLGGTDLADLTSELLAAMKQAGVHRLIFYSALGALNEVPGKFGAWNEQAIAAFLPGFRKANDLILKTPEIVTTQLRPAWLTNNDEVAYETTSATEPFKGTEVSRKSIADFVIRLLKDPSLYQNDSIGLDKPGTDGDQPSWI